ncbi:MAG: 2Fe-2S iron-sulfur cluster binding domain-containing protein [Pyrinomonadaceae bacterium]|nr:2Fe-2S iron-sulfur cluster binding domain-containing protein [Pyrinomonadaceae bacterium]
MTLVQTGLEAFAAAKGDSAPTGLLAKSPEKVLDARAKEKGQGILGFLKTVNKNYQVTWDESDPKAKFDIIHDEEIASGAKRDQSRNWLEKDERCGEGVIPVECRSAACGTCWIGVVGGAERLAEVADLERKQMKVFGYKQGDDPKPFMRLACQAQAEGSVSIVIPPWNGVFGKKLYGVEKTVLKPATTSAQKLRETIDDVLTVKE